MSIRQSWLATADGSGHSVLRAGLKRTGLSGSGRSSARHAGYCEGQSYIWNLEISVISTTDYMDMILRKTGRLLGLSCQMGALVADVSPKIADNLNLFGQEIGQAFQVQDDLLELIANQETMGKSLGSDLAAGKKTYPVVKALSDLTETQRTEFLGFLKTNANNRRLIVQELQKRGCIQQTEAVIARLFTNAVQRLRLLPEQLQPI
jgi:geranylgeranyl pyrophosphate synthase